MEQAISLAAAGAAGWKLIARLAGMRGIGAGLVLLLSRTDLNAFPKLGDTEAAR